MNVVNSYRYSGAVNNDFVFTVKSDNAGTSASNQFTIPTTGTGYNYKVTTSDGYSASGITGNHTITFPSGAGTHTVNISGDFPRIYFNLVGDRRKILDINMFGFYSASLSQENAFRGCSNIQISAIDLGDFSMCGSFVRFLSGATALTSFPLINTSSAKNLAFAWENCTNLTSFPLIDTSNVTNLQQTWINCSSLTSFPLIDTSSVINFSATWQGCSSLSVFPLIDTSSATSLASAWSACTGLNTTFPLINTANVTNFSSAWNGCRLTSFPLIDTSIGTNFSFTWRGNRYTSFPLLDVRNGTNFNSTWFENINLTSFPVLDVSNGTNFNQCWRSCTSLVTFPLLDFTSATVFTETWRLSNSLANFPANAFDGCLATNFTNAFEATNLTTTSIDNILVSIESNGTSNGRFLQSGGSAPSATGQAAIDALRVRGWTISVTGGY